MGDTWEAILEETEIKNWEGCVGRTKEEDPAEIIVRSVVGRLVWEQSETTVSRITRGVLISLQTEVANPAIMDALNYWIQQGKVGKLYSETGTRYCWGRDRGRGHQREEELGRHTDLALATMYEQRSGGKEGAKDGSPQWKAWVLWVDSYLPDVLLGRFLQMIPGDRERDRWAAAYIVHNVISLDKKEEQITYILDKLRAQFRNHNRLTEVRSLLGDHIEEVRKTASRTSEETRVELKKKNSTVCWAVNIRILVETGDRLGVRNEDWSEKGMYLKGIWLGMSIMYEVGVRPSNVVDEGRGNVNKRRQEVLDDRERRILAGELSPEAAEREIIEDAIKGHGYIMEDVKVVVRINGTIENYHGGTRLYHLLLLGTITKDMVLYLSMTINSQKTTRKQNLKKGPQLSKPAYIGRRTSLESWYLDFILEWIIHNGPRSGRDHLCVRRAFTGPKDSGISRVIRSKDIVAELRKTASLLNLNPKHFSPKSLRKGYITDARNGYVDKMKSTAAHLAVQRGSNWKESSNVPTEVYLEDFDKPGPLGMVDSWEDALLISADKYLIMDEGTYDETGEEP